MSNSGHPPLWAYPTDAQQPTSARMITMAREIKDALG